MAVLERKSMTKKEKILQIVKFALFSASAAIIQVVSYEIIAYICRKSFSLTEEQYYWSVYAVSLVLSVVWNFTFNRKFTFKSATNVPIAMLKVLAFYAVFAPLSIWWGDALVSIGWDGDLVLVITMLINFVTEFLYDDFIVFKKDKAKDKNGKSQDDE
ncbi:MAG: GtrA family protein [Clostridia bacterium]|nr:GtrA family protein [Clostridia bacterium]